MDTKELREIFDKIADFAQCYSGGIIYSTEEIWDEFSSKEGNWLESKLTQPQQTVSDDGFLDACNEVRQDFAKYVGGNYSEIEHRELRTQIDTLIIMYDQMRDKLQPQTNEGELIDLIDLIKFVISEIEGMPQDEAITDYDLYSNSLLTQFKALQNTNEE